MKKIIVCEKNADRIQNFLDSVQSRARVRTVDFNDIQRAVDTIVHHYGNIPRYLFDGMCFSVNLFAEIYPNKYRGIPESTYFCVAFRKNYAVLCGAGRENCNFSANKRFQRIRGEDDAEIDGKIMAYLDNF